MAKQRPGFIIAGESDTERTKCHTACKCREAKVEKLVDLVEQYLQGADVEYELQAAIEGVKK